MSEILNEVLSANEAYAEEFGDKKISHCRRLASLQS